MQRRLRSATMDDVFELLEQSTSSVIEVRGIIMAPGSSLSTDTWEEGSFSGEVFRISKLQLLKAEGDLVESILCKVRSPNLNLIWLHWKKCPCFSLPSCIRMRDLRILEVDGTKLERLWQPESQPPLKLRELNIHAPLLELPNSLVQLQHLEFCYLRGRKSLEVLPNSFGTLTKLPEIQLGHLESLKVLPNFSENSTDLQTISLRYCKSLKVLPKSIKNLSNLQVMNLEHCESLKVLPNSIMNLTNLQMINLEYCKRLKMLPKAFGRLRKLIRIKLEGCKSLKMLPSSLEELTNIEEITLACCESLEVLPYAFGTSTNLQHIYLAGCKNLKMLPNFPENLTNLREISLRGCKSLEVLPNSIENLTNLRKISLGACKSLEVLPNSIENLTNLQEIHLEGCESLKMLPNTFGNLTNLQHINLAECKNLEQIPSDFLANLLRLKHLHLTNCHRLTISIQTLGNIATLECLDLSGCLEMEVLPVQVLHQSSLKRLNLLSTNIKELPSGPTTVCLGKLEVLKLGSPLLKVLPPWLGYLTNLKQLQVHGCQELNCLPDSAGELAQLEVLDIANCGIQYLPPAVMKMNNLKTLGVRGCPFQELPFKKAVEGEPSLLTESATGMIQLNKIHLHCTEISEVAFPEGVCPNLHELKITCCNGLVEVGALPTSLLKLDLRGCGELRKIGGLCDLANLEDLDITECRSLEVEEVMGVEAEISLDLLRRYLRSLKILKTQFQDYRLQFLSPCYLLESERSRLNEFMSSYLLELERSRVNERV